jgi:hypothetical protein
LVAQGTPVSVRRRRGPPQSFKRRVNPGWAAGTAVEPRAWPPTRDRLKPSATVRGEQSRPWPVWTCPVQSAVQTSLGAERPVAGGPGRPMRRWERGVGPMPWRVRRSPTGARCGRARRGWRLGRQARRGLPPQEGWRRRVARRAAMTSGAVAVTAGRGWRERSARPAGPQRRERSTHVSPVLRRTWSSGPSALIERCSRRSSDLNCMCWSIGDVWLHGIGPSCGRLGAGKTVTSVPRRNCSLCVQTVPDRHRTRMRPPCVKRQIAPKSGCSLGSAVQVLAPSAGGRGC